MKTLYFLVGNIGSGKSTKAAEMAKHGCVVVCRDSIRKMLAGGGYSLNHELDINACLSALFCSLMYRGVDIVLDETNLNLRFRKEKIKLAKEFGYKSVAIILPKLSKGASVVRRLLDDHRGFDGHKWAEIWQSFEDRGVIPTKDEGFDEIIQVA